MNKERLTNLKETLKKNKEFITLDIVEQLEKENKIMKDILIDDLKKIEQLIQQIEIMKCCGNCKYRIGSIYSDQCMKCKKQKKHSEWELVE